MTSEFNSAQFEKRLSLLKDSQDSINSCCHWCLENKQYHKKIVVSWFNVLKRAKVEQRLTLFYLANDVIQYSKRKNYDFVESWVTTLQKATTMVRDEKVKHKILRIFKIWEQRGVYGEEFISDLCGLISASPKKTDEPSEFQLSYLIQKIKSCSNLETETDHKLKQLKEHNPKIQIETESLITSLKDRAHVDDVEKELDDYTKHIESYVNALKTEIKARTHLISLLQQAQTQLETERKDVKVVANAYKTFGTRVKNVKKKLDEVLPTLPSPIPSPDINAPSPSPDSDIELPVTETANQIVPQSVITTNSTIFPNAGYYNPAPLGNTEDNTNIQSNNFSSFMGANNPFNLQNFSTATLFNKNQEHESSNLTGQPAPPQPVAAPITNYQYSNSTTHVPILPPPPMPPFTKQDESYGTSFDSNPYNSSVYSNSDMGYTPSTVSSQSTPTVSYNPSLPHFDKQQFPQTNNTYPPPPANTSYNSSYDMHDSTNYDVQATTDYNSQTLFNNKNFESTKPYEGQQNVPVFTNSNTYDCSISSANITVPQVSNFSQNDEYNPEEEPETWDTEVTWEQVPPVELDTPESPPLYEKEGYNDPVEYRDRQASKAEDVDQRILPVLTAETFALKDIKPAHRGKDVDHRNLISLTGSPGDSSSSQTLDTSLWSKKDQDYRNKSENFSAVTSSGDKDYRTSFNFNNLNLPPPPPPPPTKSANLNKKSPRKYNVDNNESIDMDLSDDENQILNSEMKRTDSSNHSVNSLSDETLQPPPPFPELADDIDANNFLDSLNNELNCGEFEPERPYVEDEIENRIPMENSCLNQPPPPSFGAIPFDENRWNVSTMPPPSPYPNMLEPVGLLPIPTNNNGWNEHDFSNVDHSMGYRGRGAGRVMNNFGMRGSRGNWTGNNYNRVNDNHPGDGSGDFRGRGKGWISNGHFRGSRGGQRGAYRGFNRGARGRGNFRGNFRGNY